MGMGQPGPAARGGPSPSSLLAACPSKTTGQHVSCPPKSSATDTTIATPLGVILAKMCVEKHVDDKFAAQEERIASLAKGDSTLYAA